MSEQETSTSAQRKEMIRSWLGDLGLLVEERHFDDLRWCLVGRIVDMGFSIAAVEKADEPDRIYLQSALDITEERQIQIAQLPNTERESFLWEIRLQLISMEADFHGVDDPLVSVNFIEVVFDEALTRTHFAAVAKAIRSSFIALDWMIQRKLVQRPTGMPMFFDRSNQVH